jgi:hypothetical protein
MKEFIIEINGTQSILEESEIMEQIANTECFWVSLGEINALYEGDDVSEDMSVKSINVINAAGKNVVFDDCSHDEPLTIRIVIDKRWLYAQAVESYAAMPNFKTVTTGVYKSVFEIQTCNETSDPNQAARLLARAIAIPVL